MIPFVCCLISFLLGLSMAIILKPDEVTKISYGVEIEDDGTTAVLYLKAPEHKGDIVSVLVEDKETLKVFKEKEEI